MGLQSGDLAGHSLRSMPFSSRSIDCPTMCWRGVRAARRAVCSSHRRRVCLYWQQCKTSSCSSRRSVSGGKWHWAYGMACKTPPPPPPTATPSRTSEITSSGKSTRRWRTIPLWRNSSAFCRGPGPTWINVAYKLWSTVCWRGVARSSKQMVDLSIIEHFIHCDTY